ncbi:hypothetical protein D3C75_982500 [compost metagenome]
MFVGQVAIGRLDKITAQPTQVEKGNLGIKRLGHGQLGIRDQVPQGCFTGGIFFAVKFCRRDASYGFEQFFPGPLTHFLQQTGQLGIRQVVLWVSRNIAGGDVRDVMGAWRYLQLQLSQEVAVLASLSDAQVTHLALIAGMRVAADDGIYRRIQPLRHVDDRAT